MVNAYIRAKSPKGNVGVTDVVDAGELSAYSPGTLSGFTAKSATSWTLQIGGVTGTQDVAVAKNPSGESELFVGTAGQSIAFIIGGAPGTPGQSRTDALVIYKDPFTTSVVNNGIDVVDYQVVAGTPATTGTQVPPNDATIRATIPTGSLKFVVVVGYVTIANGAGSVTTGNFTSNLASLNDLLVPELATIQSQLDDTWWEEIGRTTLTPAGDTLDLSGLASRKYLRVLVSLLNTGGAINGVFKFNNDSGSNYARRLSTNGSADAATGSLSSLILSSSIAAPQLIVLDIINIATSEKIVISTALSANAAGAANVPSRDNGYAKWTNTSDAISRITVTNGGAGDFAIGSEIVVLGHN